MLSRNLIPHGSSSAFSSASTITGAWIDLGHGGGSGRLSQIQYVLTYTSGTFTIAVDTTSEDQTAIQQIAVTAAISSGAGAGSAVIVNLALGSGIIDHLRYVRVRIVPSVGTAAGTLRLWTCYAQG